MKNQEDTIHRNHEVELSALHANIERKEYVLQTVELKVYHYEKYL
jgi:septal ring factor EnvC (AmiA/AmiB activator)